MQTYQELKVGVLSVEGEATPGVAIPQVRAGSQTTRATVLAELDDGINNPAVGSIYLSTAGKIYLRVAAAGAATDWQKVTATAAD